MDVEKLVLYIQGQFFPKNKKTAKNKAKKINEILARYMPFKFLSGRPQSLSEVYEKLT